LLDIGPLHFLRPLWLLVIPLTLWLYRRYHERERVAAVWQDAIAPHLLTHLAVRGDGAARLRPYQVLAAIGVLTSLAMAGPTWQREITPFTEDTAPLVVALELTPSMLSIDVQPTRLERAKHKLRDLLAKRASARTAVVAYAGSAHTVLPLTDDPSLIEIYLESLAPSLMPREGDRADAALTLAADLLRRVETPGTVLFMSDGVDHTLADHFAEFRSRTQTQVLFLALGTDAGGPIQAEGGGSGERSGMAPGVDLAGLEAVASAAGGRVIRATVDAADITRLSSAIRTHLVDATQEDERLRWHDAGYYLIWPIAALALLWFRPGWTVQWS